MNRIHRLLAWMLLPTLLFALGCADVHRCVHADEPDMLAQEKAELWEKLKNSRSASVDVTEADALTVIFLDVGQGDCTLLIAPDGRTMLIDAGPEGSFRAIADELDAHRISSLDVVVATHPHEDHIGSMDDVLDAYPVGTFYTIAQQSSTASCRQMYAALERCGCPVVLANGGDTIAWSDVCTVTVLNPINGYAEPDDLNDASIVLHVRYGETAVLLCGDAEELAEKRMLDTYPRSMLHADVQKLGHHGSSSSTGISFFLAVSPDYAVASCGADNDYGHPHLETLSLLYDTRTALYRTDCDGTITFRLDGTDVSVETVRKELP